MIMLLHCCSTQGQLCPTWQSYAGLPPEEGACVTGFPFCCLNPAKRGGELAALCSPLNSSIRVALRRLAAFCGSPPLVPYGTTFAPLGSVSLDFRVTAFPYKSSSLATPLCGGTTTRTMLRVTYENTASRSFALPPLAGPFRRSPAKRARGNAFPSPAKAVVEV